MVVDAARAAEFLENGHLLGENAARRMALLLSQDVARLEEKQRAAVAATQEQTRARTVERTGRVTAERARARSALDNATAAQAEVKAEWATWGNPNPSLPPLPERAAFLEAREVELAQQAAAARALLTTARAAWEAQRTVIAAIAAPREITLRSLAQRLQAARLIVASNAAAAASAEHAAKAARELEQTLAEQDDSLAEATTESEILAVRVAGASDLLRLLQQGQQAVSAQYQRLFKEHSDLASSTAAAADRAARDSAAKSAAADASSTRTAAELTALLEQRTAELAAANARLASRQSFSDSARAAAVTTAQEHAAALAAARAEALSLREAGDTAMAARLDQQRLMAELRQQLAASQREVELHRDAAAAADLARREAARSADDARGSLTQIKTKLGEERQTSAANAAAAEAARHELAQLGLELRGSLAHAQAEAQATARAQAQQHETETAQLRQQLRAKELALEAAQAECKLLNNELLSKAVGFMFIGILYLFYVALLTPLLLL
jgi:hypothetical protein